MHHPLALQSRCLVRWSALVAFSVGLLGLATPAQTRAERIELTSGHAVEGDVLKETDRELFVDIGVDVVKVPINRIRHRGQPAAETSTPEIKTREGELYTSARLPSDSINELTRKYGEAVVLIETPSGLGSGFILDRRGHCVTNYHVIEKETRIAVTIFHRNASGEFVRRQIPDVRIVALNPYIDLALLQVPPPEDIELQHVYLTPDGVGREGEEVFAIGNPLGLERSVSRGIIGNRNRNFEGLLYVQTTAQINPGNSGGPLFNARGEVIGVTNMKLAFGEGLGFAIPIEYLKYFLDNRDAFAFDRTNANTGYRYLEAPRLPSQKPSS